MEPLNTAAHGCGENSVVVRLKRESFMSKELVDILCSIGVVGHTIGHTARAPEWPY